MTELERGDDVRDFASLALLRFALLRFVLCCVEAFEETIGNKAGA